MSMQLRDLIDKEDIVIDSKRLSEWQRNAGKFELFRKIDEVRDKFVEDNVSASEKFSSDEVISLIYKITEKVKSI